MKYSWLLLPVLLLASCKKEAHHPSSARVTPPVAPLVAVAGAKVEPLPGAWKFSGFTDDEDLSGIAAWDEAHCLVCTDEKFSIQPGTMNRGGRTLSAGAAFALVPGASGDTEVDAEGVAAAKDEGCYYVTGSHGVGKKKADFQQSRCFVVRIPVDPATGRVMPAGISTASLLPWVEQDAVLGKFARQPLQLNGFNIEGLAYRKGKLYFGVRGPNLDGDAFIIEVEAKSLFAGKIATILHRLKVGTGVGIRELAALSDGSFLVLAGNACAEESKKQPQTLAPGPDKLFRLFRYTPGGSAALLGEVPQPSAKAEGLLVLEEGEKTADVMVLFDSAPGGGAKTYRVSW